MPRHVATALAVCVALFLVGVGADHWRAKTAVTETAVSVGVDGVTLASATIALPDDRIAFPAGAAGTLLTQSCTACHSSEMILNQPHLGADKWAATVEKMRKAYKAPIAPGDDAKIVAALLTLPAQRVGTGSAPE